MQEQRSINEIIEQLRNYGVLEYKEINKKPVYVFKSPFPDTEMLKLYKSRPDNPKKLIPFSREFAEKLYEKIGFTVSSVPKWVYFEFNNRRFYMPSVNAKKIVISIALGMRPLIVGSYGTGKTTIAINLLWKAFDRAPVYVRVSGSPSRSELFGEVDPLSVYFTMNALVESLKMNGYLNREIHEVESFIGELLMMLKYKYFAFSQVGLALYLNAPLVIDEVDKLSKQSLNMLGSLFQQEDPSLTIEGLGSIEANIPLIATSNTNVFDEFILTRLREVYQPSLPQELLDDLLSQYGVDDEDIIAEIHSKYLEFQRKLGDGEDIEGIPIRKLIYDALEKKLAKDVSF